MTFCGDGNPQPILAKLNETCGHLARVLRRGVDVAGDDNALQLYHGPARRALSIAAIVVVSICAGSLCGGSKCGLQAVEEVSVAVADYRGGIAGVGVDTACRA